MENKISLYIKIRSYISQKWKSVSIRRLTAAFTLAGLALVVYAGVKTNFFYKSANLAAKGDYLYFEAGNDFGRTDAENEILKREEIEKLLPQSNDKYETSFNILSYVQSAQANVPVQRLYTLSIFMTFDIENTGNQEAQNVELTLPVNGFCKIIKTGEKPIFSQIENRQIKLGNIQPTDRVLIAIWGDKPIDDYGRIITNLIDSYATRLQYNGDDAAHITFPTKIGNFEAWLRRQIGFFFPIIVLISFLIGSFALLVYLASPIKDKEMS